MNHDSYPDSYIADIMTRVRTFAFVGASPNTSRPSYFAMKYLIGKGYRVIPVNPGHAGELLLEQTFVGSLEEITEQVDVVDVFRNSAAALDITRSAIALKDKLGISCVWMQIGVHNDVAAAEAEAAGLKVVMNRCPKIEYGRLSGEIGWMGFNTGSVSARRPLLAPGGVQRQVIRKG